MNRNGTRLEGYLLDLDGTVYLGDRLVPGADAAIAELRDRGRRIVFLSNKPLSSRADYARKLTSLNVPAAERDVIHSSYVLARHLAAHHPGESVFVIGEPPLLREIEEAGMVLCDDPAHVRHVVAAFDRTFDYRKLNIAFQSLKKGARFWATNPDRTCPVDGGELPDAAGVIAALEATTGRQVDCVVGKPSAVMVDVALKEMGLPAECCAMVGDRLETDIRMALSAGLIAVLTLTGVTSRADLIRSSIRPDYVVDSLADLPRIDERVHE